MPLIKLAATKPLKSPTTPPPTATIQSDRSYFFLASLLRIIWKLVNDFDSSPGLILSKSITLLEGIDFFMSSMYAVGIFLSVIINILLFFDTALGR